MIELNHLLLFLAIVTPLAVLTQAWRPGPTYRGWRIAAIAVLVIAGISWLFFRNHAGYIAGGAWLALLFVPAIGLRRVADLAAHRRYKSARRLATALQIFHPSGELRHQVELFRTLETRPDLATPIWPRQSAQDRHRRRRSAPMVITFIALNIAAFIFEITQGGWQNWNSLHRIGALEPVAVIFHHQYWRLFTALFLHYGYLHLLFNLFALYVLGPPLERAIGAVRFFACYLISGMASSAGVVALARVGIIDVDQLVGASGCVMGIVGAWAAFLLRHQHMPLAKQRLMNVAMIIVIQIAFDLSTPQISMAAHLCGLITGFLVGLVIGPKKQMSI